MKSLLATALALGVTVNGQYYIGNYTVSGKTSTILPYPLGVCVPNGALSDYNYVMYTCDDTTGTKMITEYIYSMEDSTCESAYTTKVWAVTSKMGYPGYSDCGGNDDASFVQVGQYIGGCSGWSEGSSPSAITYISVDDACVYAGLQAVGGGVYYPLYSETSCDGDGYSTTVHLNDPTCSDASIVKEIDTSLGCHFFETTDGLNVYTAWMECYDGEDEEYERCDSDEEVAEYAANVVIYNITTDAEADELLGDLFWYTTVEIGESEWEGENEDTANITFSLGFCTLWEFEYYEEWLSDLGSAIAKSDEVNHGAKICWSCLDFSYGTMNKTSYADFVCDKTQQCWVAATSTMTTKSASSVYVSMISLIGLLLFSIHF